MTYILRHFYAIDMVTNFESKCKKEVISKQYFRLI